jgi:hypothetical protein
MKRRWADSATVCLQRYGSEREGEGGIRRYRETRCSHDKKRWRCARDNGGSGFSTSPRRLPGKLATESRKMSKLAPATGTASDSLNGDWWKREWRAGLDAGIDMVEWKKETGFSNDVSRHVAAGLVLPLNPCIGVQCCSPNRDDPRRQN